MEISPPTNMQQQGGVKLGADGAFQMENVPEEMRAILADIQKKKAEAEAKAAGGAGARADSSATNLGVGGHAPPPPPPPDTGMPPSPPPNLPRHSSWVGGAGAQETAGDAAQHRLQTENIATMQHAETSEAMDTLLLFSAKEQEVSELQEKVASQVDEIEALTAQVVALRAGASLPPPLPPAALAPAAPTVDAAALAEASESRERAEEELGAAKAMATKLTAQLNAVSARRHRHRTAAALHSLTAAVLHSFAMLHTPVPRHTPSPRYPPLPGEHAVHGGDAARSGDAGVARAAGDPRHRLSPPLRIQRSERARRRRRRWRRRGGGARSCLRACREGGEGWRWVSRWASVWCVGGAPYVGTLSGGAASHRYRGGDSGSLCGGDSCLEHRGEAGQGLGASSVKPCRFLDF